MCGAAVSEVSVTNLTVTSCCYRIGIKGFCMTSTSWDLYSLIHNLLECADILNKFRSGVLINGILFEEREQERDWL